MAGFLYFVPGLQRLTREKAAEIGLGYAFDADLITNGEISASGGPALAAGVIAWQGAEPRVPYAADRQTWQMDPGGAFWVGFENDRPPGPEDLRRADPIGFYSPPLGDGNPWLVPTAIMADGSCPLPKTRTIDPESGAIVARPEDRFDSLRLTADRVCDAIRNGQPLTPQQEMEICLTALQTNYRIGLVEVSMLGLLTDMAVDLTCWALVDRTAWDDVKALLPEQEA